jgi:zinc protease
MEDVENLTISDLRSFYRTYYAPNNAVVAVVGDVDPDDVLDMVTKAYGQIPRDNNLDIIKLIKKYETITFQNDSDEIVKFKGRSNTPSFIMAFPGSKNHDRKAFLHSFLSTLLSGSDGSYVDQLYVHKENAWLVWVSIGEISLRYAGVFVVMGQLSEGKTLEDFKAQFDKDLYKFCGDDALNDYDVAKVKNKTLRHTYESFSSTDSFASAIVKNELHYGDYQKAFKNHQIFESITLSELKEECKQIFKPGNYRPFATGKDY